MESYKLSEREKSILRYVIHQFVLTASPVGSRNIFKKYNIGLSPASIRNIMADLEEFGFLNHPHTSAGRIPTDKGYRFYVDSLMETSELDEDEKSYIASELDSVYKESAEFLQVASEILSSLTNQIACITFPKFNNAILDKIQIVQLSSTRILVVLSIKSGLVKTISLEIQTEIKSSIIKSIERILNERLAGLQFSEIRKTFRERIKDYYKENYKPIIRVFIDSADKIFKDFRSSDNSVITGAKNILKQPEFGDHEHFQSIIELIEDKEIIIHIMDMKSSILQGELSISIGRENEEEKLSDYSVITKEYKIGRASGTLGIIGPKRMEYSKAVASVVYIAKILSEALKSQSF